MNESCPRKTWHAKPAIHSLSGPTSYSTATKLNCTSLNGQFEGKRKSMNRSSAYRFDWVEVLEDRRMFSASPQSLAMNFVATHAPLQATLKATTPNIVGTYSGTVHDSNEKSAGTMTVVI